MNISPTRASALLATWRNEEATAHTVRIGADVGARVVSGKASGGTGAGDVVDRGRVCDILSISGLLARTLLLYSSSYLEFQRPREECGRHRRQLS